ncbi:hypothetical protein ACTQ1O_05300 [Bilifractor sp. LCP21S3_A7]|uniref:hypothetical protein n=1 Tax=Bilifractor sp. LCP21S3_A7 TaxID=3438738 RepID=UPI003F8EA7A3
MGVEIFSQRQRISPKTINEMGDKYSPWVLIPLTLLLPLRFGIMGVLLAGPVADFSAFMLSVVLVGIELKKQKNDM